MCVGGGGVAVVNGRNVVAYDGSDVVYCCY